MDFNVADPASMGQVMKFNVVPIVGTDGTTPPEFLQLPAITPLPAATFKRSLALLEQESTFPCCPDAPVEVLLGTVNPTTLIGTTKLRADQVPPKSGKSTTARTMPMPFMRTTWHSRS